MLPDSTTNVTFQDVCDALNPAQQRISITAPFIWQCDCPEPDRYHRRDQLHCEDCGAFAADRPDADIYQLKQNGFHLDLADNILVASLQSTHQD